MLSVPILAGVRIEAGRIPAQLDSPAASGVLWQARAGQFLIDTPDAARFLVTGGNSIVVDIKTGASPERVARFLQMAPLAALLYQRGILACHASAIATAQGAVLITGSSGSGKSTLAAALMDRGCRPLADDIAAVELDEEEQPTVRPAQTSTVLWPDAMRRLYPNGLPARWNEQTDGARTQEEPAAIPLCAIFHLSAQPGYSRWSETDGSAMKRFDLVVRMTWNGRMAEVLLGRSAHLRTAGAVARGTPTRNLFRSKVGWDASRLADSIMEQWG